MQSQRDIALRRASLINQEDENIAWMSPTLSDEDQRELAHNNSQVLDSNQSLVSQNLFNKNEDSDGKRECFICRTLNSNTAMYDCGHVCMCEECAKSLVERQRVPKCPICRSSIKDIIKLHHV